MTTDTTTDTRTSPDTPESPAMGSAPGTRSRGGLALVALCAAFGVVQLDATVVNVALESIGRDLGGGVGAQQWIVAAYTVALAAGMLTAGSLGDRLGARRLCVAGLAVFALASAACALAPGVGTLVAARAVQGVGAAALLPCSLTLIVRRFPGAGERARALGTWGGIGSLGLAAGPVVGGALVAFTDWRVIFLINVPVCLVVATLIHRAVPEAPRDPRRAVDAPGLLLGTVALAALVGGLIEAGSLGWDGVLPLGLVGLGLVAGVAFLVVEHRRRAPMLPLAIFGSRAFSGATVAGGVFNLCLYGTLLCLSLMLQGPLHQSAARTGLLVLPLTVVVGLGATAGGRLTARWGARVPMLAGFGLGALGAVVLASAGGSGPVGLIVLGSVLLGGCSVAMPAMTATAMSGPGPEHTGVASGVLNTARQAGGALGTAVLGTLLTLGGAMSLVVPMVVVVVAYAGACVATWSATRR